MLADGAGASTASPAKLHPGKSCCDRRVEFINSRFLQRGWRANNRVRTQRIPCRYKSGEGISKGSCQPESHSPRAKCQLLSGSGPTAESQLPARGALLVS